MSTMDEGDLMVPEAVMGEEDFTVLDVVVDEDEFIVHEVIVDKISKAKQTKDALHSPDGINTKALPPTLPHSAPSRTLEQIQSE
ncbi:hypothetical protein Dimus_018124 [Dionaea muscipula]